mgnify:CR=1 FL=1
MSTLFVNNIKHTNDTSAMTIDSAGRILTPARPAFRAEKRASNQSVSDSTNAKITFEHEAFDIGGNYASDKFTAPVAGIYHFNACLRCVANSGTMEFAAIYLFKNGSHFTDVIQIQTSSNNLGNSHISGSVTIQLAASDYIEIYGNISGTSPVIHAHASGQRTFFSGFLIG